MRYTTAFVGFRATLRNHALADVFGSAVVEHMANRRRGNIVLVERLDLQSMFDEYALSSSRARMPAGKLHGVDALIMGQVLDSRVVEESKHTGHGESIYQDGFRPEPNPDHIAATAEVDAAIERFELAQSRLADAKARLARYDHVDPHNSDAMARRHRARALADVAEARQRLAGAATKLGIAEIRLAATPRDVLVPNMVKHEYPIYTITRTAKVSCMLKMLDTATGELILAERIEGRHAHSDCEVIADPMRNVPADPLELPDDLTLIEEAANVTIVKLRRSLSMASSKHGHRFVAQMRHAETTGDMVRAADNAVKYLFAHPVRHEHTDRMLSFLRKYLGPEDGLVDISGLLRTHSRLLLARAEFPAQLEERDGEVLVRRFYRKPSRDVRYPCTLSSIDGLRVHSITEVQTLMDHCGADEHVSITVLSRGQHMTTDLQLRPRRR